MGKPNIFTPAEQIRTCVKKRVGEEEKKTKLLLVEVQYSIIELVHVSSAYCPFQQYPDNKKQKSKAMFH